MEGLGKFLDSLSQSLSQEEDCAVGDEFCALLAGISDLRDAIQESEEATKEAAKEEKGESEAAMEGKTKADVIFARAWRVEYDLTRFIG